MEITVPKVGLTVEVVEVLEWQKDVGDEVTAGETVVELAADKADVEVEAPESGVLTEIVAAQGQEVAPGQVLGIIGTSADGEHAARTETSDSIARSAEPTAAQVGGQPGGDEAPSGDERPAGVGDGGSPDRQRGVRASPIARRIAQRAGVDLATIAGSGAHGRIVERDVRHAVEQAEKAVHEGPEPASAEKFEEVAWTPARRMTARRIAESAHTVAPVTLHRRVDASAALAAQQSLKAIGMAVTFSHLILWSATRALEGHPALNTVWDGDRLLRAKHIHLGIAVDRDGELYAPVLRNAETLSLSQLITRASTLVRRCRNGELDPEDFTGATFTVSNLGMLGVEGFTPIVNLPQVAILGVGAITYEGAADAGIPRCHLSLTFDHRAVDGAPSARFLDELANRLEHLEAHVEGLQ